MLSRTLCSTIARLLLVVSGAAAQGTAPSGVSPGTSPAEHRSGWWGAFGPAYGLAGLSCTGCDYSNKSGFGGNIALGGTIHPHWRLGADGSGWYKSESGTTVWTGVLALAAFYYPSLTNEFWIKAGPGVGYTRLSGGEGGTVSSTGFGYTVGAGYDILTGGKDIALTPFVAWVQQVSGNADVNGASSEKLTGHILQIGLDIGYKH